MGCTKVVMKKPIYLGQALLDLSQIVMYKFHYDYMKLKFKDFAALLHGHRFTCLLHKNRGFLCRHREQCGRKIQYLWLHSRSSSPTHWKEQESNRVDERWVRRHNNDRIRVTEAKTLFL